MTVFAATARKLPHYITAVYYCQYYSIIYPTSVLPSAPSSALPRGLSPASQERRARPPGLAYAGSTMDGWSPCRAGRRRSRSPGGAHATAHWPARQGRDELRADQQDLLPQPDSTDLDLAAIGLLAQMLLASRLVPEVLHRVGEPDLPSVKTRLFHRPVEQLVRRPDEGMAGQILLVARLLAHPLSLARAAPRRTRSDMSCMAIERTARASRRFAMDLSKQAGSTTIPQASPRRRISAWASCGALSLSVLSK